jgi:DNA replicative helicase MCM subunit Mcm2 (Cdc46/Mcm family)
MRLSDKVLPIDAERAKSVMDYYLRKVATEGGVIDIDNIMTGISHNRLQRRTNIIDAIEQLDEGRGVSQDEVFKKVKADGYDEEKVSLELQRMMREGILWNPDGDRYKVMRREPR